MLFTFQRYAWFIYLNIFLDESGVHAGTPVQGCTKCTLTQGAKAFFVSKFWFGFWIGTKLLSFLDEYARGDPNIPIPL